MPSPSHKKPKPKPKPRSKPKPRKGVPDQFTDAARGPRLQKVLAEAGIAARRECEQYIIDGRIRVNGQPVTALPAWVDPTHDRIEFDGQPIPRTKPNKPAQRLVYLMLYKPRNVISTTHDPHGRRSVVDLVDLPKHIAKRFYPVGRLDADSTGLLLLTNDGELANHLTHPRYGVTKQYEVSIRGRLTEANIARLKQGLYLATPNRTTRKAQVANVKLISRARGGKTQSDRTNLQITLKEGQNREIRRMLARLGYNVRRLKRTAIGPLKLKGLTVGNWRPLTNIELQSLRKAAKL